MTSTATASIDLLGDTVDGRPTMNFADPVTPGKTGAISVPPHGHCKITVQASG